MGAPDTSTIFAVASGAATRAALVVLRLSGPSCAQVLAALCRTPPPPREARVRALHGADGTVLDRALVLWFPAPHSYTGEDCLELHLHGGRAVLAAVSDRLLELGLRPAEAGEFTRRAFLNRRLDLLQAEAVADLAAAETEAQRRQALVQMQGGLSAVLGAWKERLIGLLAMQEALIDFPDEDLPESAKGETLAALEALHAEITAHLCDGYRGERLREGLTFAITGRPNAGKSTLMNALVKRDVAIVAPSPGTTRDVLEARLDLGGVPVTLLDTAGLREASDLVEAEGVRRAEARVADADFVVEVIDATAPAPHGGLPACRGRVLKVASKLDLAPLPEGADLGVAAPSGLGLGALRAILVGEAMRLTESAGPPPLTRARHRAALGEAATHLAAARMAAMPELRGEDLRLALRALGRLTGEVGVEEVLDSLFGQFCIGK